jgi:hypothetical protein
MTTAHPVPSWALIEIGNIIVSAGLLESTVRNIVISQIGLSDAYAECATRELSFKQMLAIAKCFEAENEKNKESFQELDDLLQTAQEAMNRRNSIAHSEWGLSEDGTLFRFKTTAKFSSGLRTSEFEETAESLKAITHAILTCDSALWHWRRKLYQLSHET